MTRWCGKDGCDLFISLILPIDYYMCSKRCEFVNFVLLCQFGAAGTLPVGGELSGALSPHRYSLTDGHSAGNGIDGCDSSAYFSEHVDGW